MPRIVNHDTRREELTQHVWQLIRKQGLSGVTIRNLSQESGWSSGAIRHYLPTREQLLTFAAEQLDKQAEKRLRHLPYTGNPLQDFQQLLHNLLPLDDETRTWMEVWLAFTGAAISEQTYADTQGIVYNNVHQLLREILTNFQAKGWQVDPEQGSTELHALLDGLSIHLLLRQITPEQAREALEVALGRVLVEPAELPTPPAPYPEGRGS